MALLVPGEASAHGRKTLVNGKYQIVCGFLTEPTFTGQRNGIDPAVCRSGNFNPFYPGAGCQWTWPGERRRLGQFHFKAG